MAEYFFVGLLGFFSGVMLSAWLTHRARQQKPAKLAGATIPELGDGLDMSKRYDIVYGGGYGAQFTEKLLNVTILGYVGREDDESASKFYMRGRWMVVEFPDRRRAYLMPDGILGLQESIGE